MTETDLEALNFPDAPRMVSAAFPIPCGRYTNVMRVMPSLTIPSSLMHKALDIFGAGLASL